MDVGCLPVCPHYVAGVDWIDKELGLRHVDDEFLVAGTAVGYAIVTTVVAIALLAPWLADGCRSERRRLDLLRSRSADAG